MSKVHPEIKINIGGKERTLIMDLNAMVAFEEVTGKNLLHSDMADISAKDLRALLWAGLICDDQTVTLKQAGSWVTLDNMQEVVERVGEAWKNAVTKRDKNDAAPLAETPLIGSTSGALAVSASA